MWRKVLSDRLQIPLINADRMMLSILPETGSDGALVPGHNLSGIPIEAG